MRAERTGAVGAVAVAAVAAVVLAGFGGGADGRILRAAFDSAQNVIPGMEVRAAGHKVGTIRSVERVGPHAQLELEITDDEVWPLPRGTRASLRHGTAIGYAARFVELDPGEEGAPPLGPGALLSPDRTQTPIEFDDVFRILDREGRGRLRSYLGSADRALRGRGGQLGRGIEASGGGLEELAGLLGELDRQRDALATLVDAGARTTSAIASREGELERLISGLAGTYEELAGARGQTDEALELLPGTLELTRSTLGRADRSVEELEALTAALAPGAAALPAFAEAAGGAVARLRQVAPSARGALRSGVRALPALERLLQRGSPFAGQLGPVLERATPMMSCLRPYAPEVMAFFGTWAAVGKNYDAKGHHTRTMLQSTPTPNGTQLTSEQWLALTPGVVYAMPRPPGFNAGQPWFQPECGAGPEALDPAHDPEARPPAP